MIKEIAILTPIYISLFWGLTLLIQPGKKDKAKQLLGVFMFNAILLYTCHGIFFKNLHTLYAWIEFLYVFAMLSAYPIYFLYLQMIASDRFIAKKFLFHFSPSIIFAALVFLTTLFLSPEERIMYVKETLIEKNLRDLNLHTTTGIKGLIFLISRIFLVIQVIYYAIRGIKLANQHNKRVSNYYSDIEGKTLGWVRFINIIFLIGGISSIILVGLGRGFFTHREYSLIIPSMVYSILIFVLGHIGNYQIRIKTEFNDQKENPLFDKDENISIQRLKKELLVLFEKEKIFINSDLRITHISEKLNTNRTYVSKIINDEFKLNFNEFVNQYRVKEAKSFMEKPENMHTTLEEIADKSGFGSVNSFSRIFKEITGVTPGKFHLQNSIK